MIQRIALLVLFFLSSITHSLGGTWTLQEGETIEADLLSFRRGTVILEKVGGGKLLYQIDRFIEDDQRRIRETFPGGVQPEKPDHPKQSQHAQPREQKAGKLLPEKAQPEKEVPRMPHLKKTSIGDSPPEFLFYQQGSPDSLSLEDYRGHLVLIHFWSTQSPASLEGLPYLSKLHQVYSPNGLKMISIALEKQRSVMNRVEKQFGITWPAAVDRSQKIAGSFGVHMLPTFVLVDQNGFIVSDNARPNQIEGDIRTYLGMKPLN